MTTMTKEGKTMTLAEKYWETVGFVFLRYFSVLMMASGVVFILLGYFINPWFYTGTATWPLFIMWGVVNFKYIHVLSDVHRL